MADERKSTPSRNDPAVQGAKVNNGLKRPLSRPFGSRTPSIPDSPKCVLNLFRIGALLMAGRLRLAGPALGPDLSTAIDSFCTGPSLRSYFHLHLVSDS